MFVYISNRQNLWEWKNLMLFNKTAIFFTNRDLITKPGIVRVVLEK